MCCVKKKCICYVLTFNHSTSWLIVKTTCNFLGSIMQLVSSHNENHDNLLQARRTYLQTLADTINQAIIPTCNCIKKCFKCLN